MPQNKQSCTYDTGDDDDDGETVSGAERIVKTSYFHDGEKAMREESEKTADVGWRNSITTTLLPV